MAVKKTVSWDDLPLYASDRDIGEALLGRERAGEFAGKAALLERAGFPKIDLFWGGRYVPAVRQFFDIEYGIAPKGALHNPSGTERPEAWKTGERRKAS